MSMQEAAQGVAWFVVVVCLGIAAVLAHDIRKELQELKKKERES